MGEFWKQIHCGNNVTEVVHDENCVVMKLQDEGGEGTMTAYEVFLDEMLI